ncbi:MAG TPA: hypothetical protein VLL54_11345 [Pyrinomonadaceae bacterium]|nr:hypothetical protein [Pyrinomonadaceae bacterium]
MTLRNLWRLCPLLTALLLCAFEVTAQRPTPASINSYASQIDRFARQHRARVFANIFSESEDEQANWREFKNAKDLENSGVAFAEQADVWLQGTNPVRASITIATTSGDWVQDIDYYFREDGTIAKIRSQLNTFHGNVSVIKEKYFDTTGTLLRTTTRVLDLKSRKRSRSRDYMDQEIPFYRRAQELPFYKLL